MSWLDPAHAQESAEDRDLRQELGALLGVPERNFFGAEPTPRLIALAEDLRREAMRRRHTARQRPLWMLMAAALPVALAVGVLGSWGYQHKQRADALAAAVNEKNVELQQMAKAAAEAQFKAAQAAVNPITVSTNPSPRANPTLVARATAPKTQTRPGELVIELSPSTSSMPPQTQTVKQRGE